MWTEGVWTGSGQQAGTFAVGDGTGSFLFRNCPGTTAVTVYQRQGDAWSCVYACKGLKASVEKQGTSASGILGFSAGGLDRSAFSGVNPLSGLQILGLAVFDGELSVESAAEYLFPSEQGVGIVTLEEGENYSWSTLSWSGHKPSTTSDEMVIRVNGDAVLEMDESSVVALKCTVEGSGSLVLMGAGRLSGHRLVTTVPLKLQTPTGTLTLAGGLDTDLDASFGNGEVCLGGAIRSTGLTGSGTLKVTGGTVVLRGDEDFTGPVQVEGEGTVVTTNGVLGVAGICGNGRVCFQGVLPITGMQPFFKSESWKGRVQLDRITGNCADLNPDLYSNPSSKTVLAGVRGWVPASVTFANEVVLENVAWDGTQVVSLDLCDGYGSGDATVFAKLSGRGWLKDTHASEWTKQILRFVDVSDFHGTLFMKVKRAVIGPTAAPKVTGGTVFVPAGFHLDAYGEPDTDECGIICARNGVFIDGEVTVAAPAFFVMDGVRTPVTVGNTGILRFAMNASFNHQPYNDRDNQDYSIVGGTGRLEFTDYGSGVLRTWPLSGQKMWQGGLEVFNLQGTGVSAGILLTHRGTIEEPAVRSLDTLSGAGCFRTDANMTQVGSNLKVAEDRSIRVVQARDTTWSGVMAGEYDNLADFRVAAAETAAGATLRMTGVNALWRDRLVVEAGGGVRMDGVWNGDMLVEGTLGGCGTNTNGRLTFAAGAIYDARQGLFHADEIGEWSSFATVWISEKSSSGRTPIMDVRSVAAGVRGTSVAVRYDDGTTDRLRLSARGGQLVLVPEGLVVTVR